MVFTHFESGDLVRWYLDPHKHSNKCETAIVIDVHPRNVYEPEACVILCDDGIEIVMTSRYLTLVSKEKTK